jgi:penicillin-binding protein 1C
LKRVSIAIGCAVALVCASIALLRALPWAPLLEEVPLSTAVYADDGSLMRLALASDEQFRVHTRLEEIAPNLREAVLLYEDRYFYRHFGVNAAALARSIWGTLTGPVRQGGSTVTMQLARKRYAIDSSTYAGKLQQIFAALWIEARYSKDEILEAYLNLTPYGGNIEGIGAASLVYFHKRAADLNLAEALALAVIPQNPRKRAPAHDPASSRGLNAPLRQGRDRLWAIWRAEHPGTGETPLDLQPYRIADLPFKAPHVSDALIAANAEHGELHSTIDLSMQRSLERMVALYVRERGPVGIRNASALLLDTETMRVKALAGSADYFSAEIQGQVNGSTAKRSPGSTLKPFVYALALDQGLLHPLTVVKDAPTAFGPFSPENFDGRFVGPLSAQEALIRSRNVPAVAIAARLSQPSLYDFLKEAGVERMQSEAHYGLALSLGGGEVTMEELARMYALLANEGRLRSLRYTNASDGGQGAQLLSEEAAFITLDMLRRNPRPDTGLPASPTVAWKTGTSWGFRDAWTAGVFGRYVLIVWVGNFDGTPNPAFVGVQAAAPLLFRIVDGLRAQGIDEAPALRAPPAKLAKVEVCAASGDLPNAHCPALAETWFIPGKSPIRVSTLHRPALIDTRNGEAVCAAGPHTRTEVYEFWPSDMQRLFSEAGMPRRLPPRTPDCADGVLADAADAPHISSPLRGATYTLRASKPVSVPLRAAAMSRSGNLYWFVDNAFLGSASATESTSWMPQRAGRFIVRVVDEEGRADMRAVNVEFAP